MARIVDYPTTEEMADDDYLFVNVNGELKQIKKSDFTVNTEGITQAEYDALPEDVKNNGVFFITDAPDTLTVAEVNEKAEQNKEEIAQLKSSLTQQFLTINNNLPDKFDQFSVNCVRYGKIVMTSFQLHSKGAQTFTTSDVWCNLPKPYNNRGVRFLIGTGNEGCASAVVTANGEARFNAASVSINGYLFGIVTYISE